MDAATLTAALGWALLDFVWQGLLLGALAALGLLVLRDARPQARYALGCVALALCLLLPLHGLWRGLAAPTASAAPAAGELAIASVFGIADAAAADERGFDWRALLQAQLPAVVACWAVGTLLLGLRLLLGWRWVGRLRVGARLPDPYWQGRFDELAVHVGLRAPVPLRIGAALDTPVAAGWWRPVVLVPAALLARMPPELMEALLAHELAHVRRRDYLVNLLQGVVETLLFYHPVVWWLSRRVRVERERIADDLAARALGEPRQLARALQALDAFQHEAASGPAPLPRAPGLVLAANGDSLMSRIQRLVRPDPQRPDWKLALPLAGLAALALAVHAAAAPVPAVAPAPAPAPMATAASVAPLPRPAPAPLPATRAVPALAPLPAVAAASALSASGSLDANHESYAMVRAGKDAIMLSGELGDAAEVKRLRERLHGDFLWFRRDGTAYVVQDPALIADARRAWAPAEELGARMEALGEQMRPHGERMEALGKQMERLGANGEPFAQRMEELARQVEPLAAQQAELGEQARRLAEQAARTAVDEAGLQQRLQELHARMDGLHARMEPLHRQMQEHGQRMQEAHGPMQELARKMEAASAPMHELGKKLEALGEQHGSLARRADVDVQRLIDQALRSGKAVRAQELER